MLMVGGFADAWLITTLAVLRLYEVHLFSLGITDIVTIHSRTRSRSLSHSTYFQSKRN